MNQFNSSKDITRTTLAVLFIGILISSSFWILRPFLMALTWATMIVITTWPVMLSIQKRVWGKRGIAVTVMTLILLMLFIIPFTFAIIALVERADDIVNLAQSLTALKIPPPPSFIEHLPMAGSRIAAKWNEIASMPTADLSQRLEPYARQAASWLVSQAGNIGMMTLQFLLTVLISAVLYSTGDKAASGVCRFARRLAGKPGEDAAVLAAKAVRGVALGVVVTALTQSVLGGIGLTLAGVPAAAVLTALMFVLCVAQIGPTLVLIPAIGWLFWQDQTMWGTIMVGWAIFVGTIDNFIRPFLIKKGADLPLLLIFSGVIGGLLAFGVIGLFIGPVLLAVTYTLLGEWVSRGESEAQEQECENDC